MFLFNWGGKAPFSLALRAAWLALKVGFLVEQINIKAGNI
jgi:hypothetical protein